jgi:NADPH:quinone reductase-like Zn-dependent oxidoreductase
VLDMVAGDYLAREMQCLADDGRMAIIAVQGGTQERDRRRPVLRKRLTITGSTLRPRSRGLQDRSGARIARPGLAADRGRAASSRSSTRCSRRAGGRRRTR